MADQKVKKTPELSTEAKIKAAARTVFHQKGFAAARTRDIAREANMNLALLKYYFKNKEKLFELVMFETLVGFFQSMDQVFNDEKTTLEKKIEQIAGKYIDMMVAEPGIPLFVMSELRNHGAAILQNLPVVNGILKSVFVKQYREAVRKGRITEPEPVHFLMNMLSLIVFPFIGSPMIKKTAKLSDRRFDELMEERKKKIPVWIKAMLKAK